ncbi:MAG: acyl-CoA thioesterase [Paracoccaceae bacterium]
MKPGQLTYRGAVYPWHCDHMGHMNVMWYVGKFDEATWAFFSSIGLSAAFLRKTARGMVAVEQSVSYKREVLPGDTLEIYTRPLEVRAKTLRFAHEMFDFGTGELAATSEILSVHLDTEARKGAKLPDKVRLTVSKLLAS